MIPFSLMTSWMWVSYLWTLAFPFLDRFQGVRNVGDSLLCLPSRQQISIPSEMMNTV